MRKALFLGVLIAGALAFGHSWGLAYQNNDGDDTEEARNAQLRHIIHKDEAALERFDELLERLDDVSGESNDAHRQGLIGQIVGEMRREIKFLRNALPDGYSLPEEDVDSEDHASGTAPRASDAVLARARARLAAMVEIHRTCEGIQESAARRQGKALKRFQAESKKFRELIQEDFDVARSLLSGNYQQAGSALSN